MSRTYNKLVLDFDSAEISPVSYFSGGKRRNEPLVAEHSISAKCWWSNNACLIA